MRFFRVHPAFILLFLLSLVLLGAGFLAAATATDACVLSNGSHQIDADCTLQAQSGGTMGIVLAIAGATVMIGAVGFQVGRSAVPAVQPGLSPTVTLQPPLR